MDSFQTNLMHKHSICRVYVSLTFSNSCVIQWLFCANMMSKIKKSSAKLVSSEISKLENSETKEGVQSSWVLHRGWTGVTSADATLLPLSLSLGSRSLE